MSTPPVFSVIIPTYNRKAKLLRCLKSVFQNNCNQLEVIVVDDGSTDSTGDAVSQVYPDVKYIYQQNKGVSAARNTGIRVAKGQYIAFLDSDDTWYPDKIDSYARVLHELPGDVGLIFNDMDMLSASSDTKGDSYYPDYFGVDIGKELSILTGKLIYPVQEKTVGIRYGYYFSRLIQGNMIQPSCAIVVRSVFDKVGLFREDLAVAEDSELFLRIARQFNVAFMPVILTSSDPPDNSTSLSRPQNNILKVQNTIKYITEYYNDEGRARYQRLLKSRLVELDFLLGYHFLSLLDRKKARSCYLQVIFARPLYWQAYLLLAVSYLPVVVLRKLHNLKKAW